MKKINEKEIEANNVRYVKEDEVVVYGCKGCYFEDDDDLCDRLTVTQIRGCSKDDYIWIRKQYTIEDLKTQKIIIEDLTESQFDSLKKLTDRLGNYNNGPSNYNNGPSNYNIYYRFDVDDFNGYIQYSGKEFYTKQGYVVASFEDISIEEDNSFKIINENEIVIEGVSYVTDENIGCKKCCFDSYANSKVCGIIGKSILCSGRRNDKRSITWKLKKENKYTIEKVIAGEAYVHCDTEEKAKILISAFIENGVTKWCNDDILDVDDIDYNRLYKDESIYFFNSEPQLTVNNFEMVANKNKVIKFEEVEIKQKESKEMNPVYKVITSFSCSSVVKENPCSSEFNKFNSKFSPDGFFAEIDWEENEEFIIKQNGWISWLLDKKFIEEIKIDYDPNEVYIYKGYCNDSEFKLHEIEGVYSWINLNNSDCIANESHSSAIEALKYANELTGYEVYENMRDFYNKS